MFVSSLSLEPSERDVEGRTSNQRPPSSLIHLSMLDKCIFKSIALLMEQNWVQSRTSLKRIVLMNQKTCAREGKGGSIQSRGVVKS